MRNQLLHLYWIDLIELLAALVFMIVFKIVLVWGMAKVSTVLQGDDEREAATKKQPEKLPPWFNQVRWTLIAVLVGNGLWQIIPSLVGVSLHDLRETYTGGLLRDPFSTGFSHLWSSHSVWMTIWSVVIQLGLGGTLMMFHRRWVVQLIATLVGMFSILSFFVVQNFGDFNSGAPSVFTGVPSASLLLLLMSVLLWLPNRYWESEKLGNLLRWVNAAYWFLVTVLQCLPGDGFWSGRGYSLMNHIIEIPVLPQSRHTLVSQFASDSVIWTLIFGVFGLALTFACLRIQSYSRRASLWWFIVMTCSYLIVWWLGGGTGGGTLYVLPLGTASVMLGITYLQYRVVSPSRSS